MKIKKILKYAGMVLAVMLVTAFVAMGFVMFDVMSYTATGSEKLNAAGEAAGSAMVVYDPGISGESKEISTAIAKDLQSKGYNVNLAGISSADAANTLGYDILIVGGPIYAGKISSSIQSYLSSIKTDEGTKIAVFAAGNDPDTANNETLLREEVVISGKNAINVIAVMKVVSGENPQAKSSQLVLAILS
ncbi:flavodoxin domain-containing protein [Methanobacterium alcaliphilum]|uniref:flavodoxin domain-containing protein n=1 Tax=Methanobacterium alcaliphilum TaxID=392018 RepID=UPI00200A61FD|nr:flavodoxin domain-containing protein [Methanobacterium alcaliphilum]MCK9152252.1 flavodoxin domain-containing protein [Methanobacterium alcaliphilum]